MASREQAWASGPPYPHGTDPGAIRADIERTRAELDETIDALGERLKPANLVRRAVAPVRRASLRASAGVRRNGSLLAVAAVGLAAVVLGRAVRHRRAAHRRLDYSI